MDEVDDSRPFVDNWSVVIQRPRELAEPFSVHQLALSITSLQTWALATVRTGLLSQNKEGLVSLPGYLAIYILGLASGEHILRSTSPIRGRHNDEDDKRHHEKPRTELALELFSYSVAWWVALAVWRLMGGEVSRRLVSCPWKPQQSDVFEKTAQLFKLI